MGDVITIKSPEQWAETTLAKKQLAWSLGMQRKYPKKDFKKAIAKEEDIIRSFLQSVRDQLAA